MQRLLEDMELDVQELKFLFRGLSGEVDSTLKTVAKRNIQQLRLRLDNLEALLEDSKAEAIVAGSEVNQVVEKTPESAGPAESLVASGSAILAERIRTTRDLRHSMSLNDSFRFTRELFGGDAGRMNEVLKEIENTNSLDEALTVFDTTVYSEEDDAVVLDFVEFLKKYFS